MRKFSFLYLSILIIFCSCTQKKYFFIEGFAQGTTYHITYKGLKDYSFEIDSILKAFDLSLSVYNDSSLISKINRNEPYQKLDKWFTDVFNESKEVYNRSEGMFDITVGPLVKAWGFLKDTTIHHDSAHIKQLLQYVGMNKVRIENNHIIKEDPNIIIDVNAIAQGYSVDVVSEYLDKQKISNYLVEIGGEVKAKGKNPKNKLWRIGIDKPVEGSQETGENFQAIIEVADKSVSTSGNYRKFFIENGIKYTHTINPKTGFPSKNNLLSVTIVTDKCSTADAYATACMASGLERSKKILSSIKGLDGYLIFSDTLGNYQFYMTNGFKDLLTK